MLQLDYSLEKDAPQPKAATIDAMRWCWQPRGDRSADLEYSLMGYAVLRTGIQAFLLTRRHVDAYPSGRSCTSSEEKFLSRISTSGDGFTIVQSDIFS